MQDAVGREIKRNFDAFIAGANRIRDMILDEQAAQDWSSVNKDAASLKLLGETTECAETVMKQLLMAAYFTANYRSCISRTDNPKLDHKVLDRGTPEGIEFSAIISERKRKAETEAPKPKPCHIGLLDDTREGEPPAAAASQSKRQTTPRESLRTFSDDLVERYKALHGVHTNRFNLPGLTPTRPPETHILKRNELLEEINAFLSTFGLSRIDKSDAIWRDWFLKAFIGLDNPSRPITVQNTPDRRQAVYSETVSRIAEIAKKALK